MSAGFGLVKKKKKIKFKFDEALRDLNMQA